jgi:autotransporter-associated beta strand protein
MNTRKSVYGYPQILAVSIAALVVAVAPEARSAPLIWDADPATAGIQEGGGIWNTSNANWSTGAANVSWTNDPPNDAVFGGGAGTAGTISIATDITTNSLTFNTTGYTITGSPLNLAGPSTFSAASGVTATITSSIVSGTGLAKTGAGTVLLAASNTNLTGPVTVNGGTLAVDGNQNFNRLPVNAAIVINNGGTFEIRGVNALDSAGDAADVTIAAGGSLRIVSGGSAAIGANGESHAHIRNITLNGGTIDLGYSGSGNAYNQETFQLNGDITVGGSVASTVNVSNGATTAQQGIAFAGIRTITVNDVTGSAAGDFIINGELENNDAGNSGFIKSGNGTLVLGANNSYTGGTTINTGTVQVGNGGSTGSLGSGDVINNAALAFNFGGSGTIANTISGTGAVQQVGAGSTIVTGSNTYSGATQINAGKLFVNGSLAASSAVAVGAGATLGGSGTVSGTVTVNHNGLIESGDGSGIGTLTVGSLTLGGASGNLAGLNLNPITGAPSLFVSNANGLVANGGAASASINIVSLPAGLGNYTLIDYNGTLGGGFGAFKLGTLPPRLIASLVNNTGGTSIDLNVTGTDFPVWSGALNSTWSTATLANPKNWVLNSSPGTPTDFITNDSVLFNDSASGTTTVDISGGNVNPGAVTFNNSTKNYTLTGTNGIAGATGLTKTGTGTLTISAANSFTGPVNLAAGTVSVTGLANIGTPSPLGSGPAIALADAVTPVTLQITGAASATNRAITINPGGATFDISQAAGVHSQNAVVSGSGGLTKAGLGTLVLNALNTYAGNTIVNAGTLQLAASNSGAGIGAIVGTLTINSGATLRTTAPNALGWNGAQQVFTLNLNSGFFDNTAAGDQGWAITINLTGATMQSNGGVSSATTNQLFALGGGSSVNSLPSSTTSVIAGRINIRENNPGDLLPFNVADGAASTDLLVSAAMVTGAARGISKDGDGRMVISGENTYVGPTSINTGVLQVGDGGTTGTLGSGAGLVTNNATLAFNLTGSKAIANPITGIGTVQQTGTGSVILGGANDYSGPTQISAGKLFINGSLTNSPVIVSAGGALGGSGSVAGQVTVENNGAIESGNGGGSGTLTLSTLALGAAAGQQSSFNLFAATAVPALVVTTPGGLVANGGALSSTINVGGLLTALGAYTLIDYDGTLGGGFGSFKLGTLPPRIIGSLVNNAANTSIDLNVTGTDFPVWSGALNGTWSTATLTNPKNWVLNSSLGTPTDFITGDNVLFNDTASGTTTVDISGANVNPNSVTFNNSTKSYTLTGTNGIAGATSLTKTGNGMLTIGNSNSFTGAANIARGIVSVATIANSGTASPLGAGSSIMLGGAGTNGTLQFTGTTGASNRPLTLNAGGGTIEITTPAGALTQSGVISGVGGFTKSGPGLLTLTTAASTFTGSVVINGGTVTVPAITGSAATTSALGDKNSARTISINTGSTLNFTVNNVFGGAGMVISQVPTLIINQGGALNATRFNSLGDITLNGGTLTQAATDGPGAYEGYQFIGTITVGGSAPSTITTTNGKANHLVGGGTTTFDVADATGNSAGDLIVSVPLRDGSGDYPGGSSLAKSGAGTMVLSATNIYTGTTTISAGTLQIGDGGTTGAPGNAQIFNDGILAFNLSNTRTFANTISGSGALQQLGTGTLILTAANDYTGPTLVNAGRLLVNSSPLGPGTVTVNAGGTLGGNGTIPGAVMVTHNGAIESGNGTGSGTLTVGSLTLGAVAGNLSTFNLFVTTGVPAVIVTGMNGLIANGGANSSTINVGGPAPTVGSYPLIDYSGTLGGGFGSFKLGNLPPRVIGSLVNNTANTSIDLNVTGTDFPIWSGALNSTWSTAAQTGPKNWVLNSSPATPTDFISGDSVLFNDNASGTTTVDISGANVTPAAVTFNHSTKDYTLTGSNGIAGSTGVTKMGTGTLTIGNSNSFTGMATIAAGAVSVASVSNAGVAGPLGAGPLALGGALTNGTLRFTSTSGSTNRPAMLNAGGGTFEITDAAGTLTQSGALSGAGGLTKTGPGTLSLSTATSSFSGNVAVNAGILTVPAITGSGDLTSALGEKSSMRTITVNDTATLRFTTNNVFGGAGMTESQIPMLVINQGGTLSATRFNTIGNLTMNGGTLTQASTDPAPDYEGYQFIGTITVSGSVPSTITTTNGKANHLRGGGETIFDVSDVTGNSAADLIVSTPISDGSGDYGGQGTLTKTGLGTMQINSVSAYTGPTNINAGKLIVNGSIVGSTVNVGANASIGGTGTTGFVQVADNGVLAPGASVGTLTVGTLLLGNASRLEFELGAPGIIGGTESDLLTITGDLTLDGILHLIASPSFDKGTYRLGNYTGILTDNTLDLEPAFLLAFPGSRIDTATLGQVNLIVVPEPGTALSLLGGLAALGLGRRRCR